MSDRKESASKKQRRGLYVLTMCALLSALSMILSFFTIRISESFQFNLSLVPLIVIGALYGPGAGALSGLVIDLLGYLANPNGAFFPGFTLTSIVSGLLLGLVLYRRPPKMSRLLAASFLNAVVCSIGMNSLWLNIMYGKSTLLVLPARIGVAAAVAAIDALLAFVVLKALTRAGASGPDLTGRGPAWRKKNGGQDGGQRRVPEGSDERNDV